MSRGKGLSAIALLAITLSACVSAPQASEPYVLPNDRPLRASAPTDPLRCTDREAVPLIEHVTSVAWSADSSALAVSRIVTVASDVTIAGFEEDLRITLLNVKTGAVHELGPGSRPHWSGSGAYLSYWHDDGYLHVVLKGATVGVIEASSPEVRWSGDDLYHWYAEEIRVWRDGATRTVAQVAEELAPRYPRDDAYFSADAQRFTVTSYSPDGTVARFVGTTNSGEMAPLDEPDATFTEWSPRGKTLLVRSGDRLTLHGADGSRRTAPLSAFPGTVHHWTADGRILVGAVSPTIPGGNVFDRIPVWDPFDESDKAVATLPNLFGLRSFSPDGRHFTGVSRTGLYPTQLELYRCGVSAGGDVDIRADPASRSHLARIDADSRRFVRPVAGVVTQFLHGRHTGVDIAAPFGSLIVAADEGTVSEVGWVPVGGRRVCVRHADAIESCYYHTSAALVSIGDRVARGQPIALIGLTGATTGPHVHWEVTKDGRIVDPLGL